MKSSKPIGTFTLLVSYCFDRKSVNKGVIRNMSGSEESPISDDCPINKEWIIRFLQKHHDTRNGITIVVISIFNSIYFHLNNLT